MAHAGEHLPPIRRVITTHNSKGKAVFSDAFDTTASVQTIGNGAAGFSLAYITSQFPVNLNGDEDMQIYRHFLDNPPGLVQSNGSLIRVVDMAPELESPMHRTVSLDYGVVLIGEVEMILDSGETRMLKPGNIWVQRGTMHAWRNPSKTQWSRMICFLQPSMPVAIEGKQLKEDYGTMRGVKPSS